MEQKELEAIHIAVHEALSAIVSLKNDGHALSKRNFSTFFGDRLEEKLKNALSIVEAEECLCLTASDGEIPHMGTEDPALVQDVPQMQYQQM